MSAEILKEIKEMKTQQNEMYKRLFVSNGRTALVEEVKQTIEKLDSHIAEDKIISCGSNPIVNKVIDKIIGGAIMAFMVIFVLGIKTWVKTI